jgi:RND family efflux transporter MFP subunit
MHSLRAMNRPFSRAGGGFAAGLAVLCLMCGCRDDLAVEPKAPLPVNVVTAAERNVVEYDVFTGRVEAAQFVEIRPRVTGYIREVRFTPGPNTIVKKGDVLFVIDPRPYQADYDRAVADLDRAEAAEQFSRIEYERARELRAKNTISSSEFDQRAATFNQAKAASAMAKAARDAAKLNLEFTEIQSPIEGRISDERVKVGNLVQPGPGPESILTTVVSTNPLHVYFDADENRILKYIRLDEEGKRKTGRRGGIPIYMELSNESGFPHEGSVDFIDNRIDPGTGTLRARGVFETWNPFITPGMFCRVRIPGGISGPAVVIPDEVISSDQGQRYVYVVKADGVVERRNIVAGSVVEAGRVVRDGLKAGERVVASRLMMVQQGMKVQPVERTPAGESGNR